MRFFAGLSTFGVLSIFISIFYKRSIDLTFSDGYGTQKFKDNVLYVAIIVIEILKLVLILVFNAIMCVSGFNKSASCAIKNCKALKGTIVIYVVLHACDIILCFCIYSGASKDVAKNVDY